MNKKPRCTHVVLRGPDGHIKEERHAVTQTMCAPTVPVVPYSTQWKHTGNAARIDEAGTCNGYMSETVSFDTLTVLSGDTLSMEPCVDGDHCTKMEAP